MLRKSEREVSIYVKNKMSLEMLSVKGEKRRETPKQTKETCFLCEKIIAALNDWWWLIQTTTTITSFYDLWFL